MRLFVALNLPPTEKQNLAAAVHRVTHLCGPVRWVDAESLHITLVFLGSMKPEVVPEIRQALRAATTGVSPFDVSIGGFGAFPTFMQPRVLWVGVASSPVLLNLQAELERALAPFGIQPEARAYAPHITVGRPPKGKRIADRCLVDRIAAEFRYHSTVTMTSVDLMESHTVAGGARYEIIDKVELH